MPPWSSSATLPRSVPRGRRAALRELPAGLLMVLRTRLGLSWAGLQRFRAGTLPSSLPQRRDLVETARIAWAVRMVSRVVPLASCLTQAQACQILLARRGIASTLCLGVRPGDGDRMVAHAWLVCERQVVIGGDSESVADFRVLAELGPVA